MSTKAPRFSIILAAGQGKRMQSAELHKVCFPVAGEPAINRAIRIYKECGVPNHIVVVGTRAEQVMRTVREAHSGVFFAFQIQQAGTADAARTGAEALDGLSADADVLVTAGDKVIEPAVLRGLFELYYREKCDLAFVTGAKEHAEGLGRIVLDGAGNVLANVEAVDVRQRRILGEIRALAGRGNPPSLSAVREMIGSRFEPSKAQRAFGELLEGLAKRGGNPSAADILALIPEDRAVFRFSGRDGSHVTLTPDAVEATPRVNQSVYLLKASTLRLGLSRLTRDNAQKEEYLSDLITVLTQMGAPAEGRKVQAFHVADPEAIMGFNNPEELLEIEDSLRRKAARKEERRAAPPGLRSIADWRRDLEALTLGKHDAAVTALREHLEAFYGTSTELIASRARTYADLVSRAAEALGESESLLLVRSPGRVNLLGRHVDHQGGNCNLMTIGRETLIAVHPRDDDVVEITNTDAERFPPRRFSIGEMVAALPWDDWMSLVSSEAVLRMVREAAGDWSQYVKAAVLRLQKRFPGIRLRGADMIVSGDIPVAAGLSSSSALVVGMAEAMAALNDLEVMPAQLVDLCGEGEWFVGTRGGAADHAAIKLGQKGKVVKVTFFDFAVEDIFPFPEGYLLAVCNSGIKAQKTSNARDQFNHRVACYRLGLLLVKKLFPQYAPLLGHLRDINTRRLGIPLSGIYKILLRLPESATRRGIQDMLPGQDLTPFFATHAEPDDGAYPIRGVVLFGLSECERSRAYARLMKEGRMDEVGRLMRVSHDGDRVGRLGADGSVTEYRSSTSNAHLLDLIEDLESQDPDRVSRAQIEWQPGAYACSISEIDRMVDVAVTVPGVVGAQLAGAGLGGCMMVMLRRETLDELVRSLDTRYYAGRGMEPDVLACEPVAGSGVLLRG